MTRAWRAYLGLSEHTRFPEIERLEIVQHLAEVNDHAIRLRRCLETALRLTVTMTPPSPPPRYNQATSPRRSIFRAACSTHHATASMMTDTTGSAGPHT